MQCPFWYVYFWGQSLSDGISVDHLLHRPFDFAKEHDVSQAHLFLLNKESRFVPQGRIVVVFCIIQ